MTGPIMNDTTSEGERAIPKITRDDEAAGSGDLVRENVERLKALFPQIVTDGKVDFDVLRQLLGDEVEEGEERYGLSWKGKRRARAFAMTPSLGTLRPAPEDSVDWDTTQNLMIEGDNLEVLKLLRRSYAGKVKLIYIDPPYNTGEDFVYPDNYRDALRAYEEVTGQRRKGVSQTSDSDKSGRHHTEWLNMMMPRLMVAKELLSEDGAIFINISHVESGNLRLLLEQVFGDDCTLTAIAWKRKSAPDARDTIGEIHDTILCAIKNSGLMKSAIQRMPLSDKRKESYNNPDNDPRGPWASSDLTGMSGRATKDQFFSVTLPSGRVIGPPEGRSWGVAPATFVALRKDNRIWFGANGDNVPRLKKFLAESDGQAVPTIWDYGDVGSNDEATKEVRELFDGKSPFDSPKPLRLIERVIDIGASDGGIILDFFAGSGTTGHAVILNNARQSKQNRFILVQLPEPINPEKKQQKDAADFCEAIGKPLNIAELTKERLRRAGQKIRAEHPDARVDTGFRVYKLATSNLKPWQPDPDNLEASILDAVDNVLPDRTEHDLLVELLLKTGIDLTMPEEKRTIAGQAVHALGGGALMVCLGNIGPDDAETLGQGMADWLDQLDPTQTTIYFKDVGLGTENNRSATKANLAAILRQRHGDRIAKIASI